MNLERVIYEIDKNIAIIKINNPPANTLGSQTLNDLEQALNVACSNPEIKAVVLTGEGKYFIAGADIKEINNVSTAEEGEVLALNGQRIFDRIERMEKPIIAAINGACLGGGMELAMACHIRIADEKAKFGQPEINLGLIPGFGGTQRLARLTNKSVALEWILTGDMYSAEEALKVGVVNKVVPTESAFEEAKNMAHKIASKGSIAISNSIEAIQSGLSTTQSYGLKLEATLFGKICMTEDKKEGVQAFIEKRAPIFKDK